MFWALYFNVSGYGTGKIHVNVFLTLRAAHTNAFFMRRVAFRHDASREDAISIVWYSVTYSVSNKNTKTKSCYNQADSLPSRIKHRRKKKLYPDASWRNAATRMKNALVWGRPYRNVKPCRLWRRMEIQSTYTDPPMPQQEHCYIEHPVAEYHANGSQFNQTYGGVCAQTGTARALACGGAWCA